MRGATQSDEEKGDRLETDGNAVVAADLDVRVVPLECLREGPVELETSLLRPKGGDQGEIAGVRDSQFEKSSRMRVMGGKAYVRRLSQGWRNATLKQRIREALLTAM